MQSQVSDLLLHFPPKVSSSRISHSLSVACKSRSTHSVIPVGEPITRDRNPLSLTQGGEPKSSPVNCCKPRTTTKSPQARLLSPSSRGGGECFPTVVLTKHNMSSHARNGEESEESRERMQRRCQVKGHGRRVVCVLSVTQREREREKQHLEVKEPKCILFIHNASSL